MQQGGELDFNSHMTVFPIKVVTSNIILLQEQASDLEVRCCWEWGHTLLKLLRETPYFIKRWSNLICFPTLMYVAAASVSFWLSVLMLYSYNS